MTRCDAEILNAFVLAGSKERLHPFTHFFGRDDANHLIVQFFKVVDVAGIPRRDGDPRTEPAVNPRPCAFAPPEKSDRLKLWICLDSKNPNIFFSPPAKSSSPRVSVPARKPVAEENDDFPSTPREKKPPRNGCFPDCRCISPAVFVLRKASPPRTPSPVAPGTVSVRRAPSDATPSAPPRRPTEGAGEKGLPRLGKIVPVDRTVVVACLMPPHPFNAVLCQRKGVLEDLRGNLVQV